MMGTAYTHFIENGEITDWKDFLKLCTRAFGVFADIREKPLSADIPIYFEVKQEHFDDVKKAEKDYQDALNRTDEEWQNELDNKIKILKKESDEYKIKNDKETAIINNFINNISNWDCSAEYREIKNFALEQLRCSFPTKCNPYEDSIKYWENLSVEDFKKNKIEHFKKDVVYEQEKLNDIIKSVDEKNRFIEGFLMELG